MRTNRTIDSFVCPAHFRQAFLFLLPSVCPMARSNFREATTSQSAKLASPAARQPHHKRAFLELPPPPPEHPAPAGSANVSRHRPESAEVEQLDTSGGGGEERRPPVNKRKAKTTAYAPGTMRGGEGGEAGGGRSHKTENLRALRCKRRTYLLLNSGGKPSHICALPRTPGDHQDSVHASPHRLAGQRKGRANVALTLPECLCVRDKRREAQAPHG